MKFARWRRVRHSVAGCLLLLGATHSAAQDDAAERERIARERAAVEAAFSSQELVCQERFSVTSCVEGARRDRRKALAELRRQSTALDEAQRRRMAEWRRQSIRDSLARNAIDQSENSQREAGQPRKSPVARTDPAPHEAGKTSRGAPAARPAPARPAGSAPAASAPPRRAQEASNRLDYEARQREARMHRDEVMQRNEERASKRKPSAPLPVPAASQL